MKDLGATRQILGMDIFRDMRNGKLCVIRKSSVYAELLVPLRLVAILETNKLKPLSFSL